MTLQQNLKMMKETTEIVASFKGQDGNEIIITGKNAYLTEFNINHPSPRFEDINTLGGKKVKLFMPAEPITINMEFQLAPFDKDGKPNHLIEYMMGEYKPERKISQLKVEDCSIEELLFAVRQKIK